MAHEKVKFYFTFFFAIRCDESRTFSTSNEFLLIFTFLKGTNVSCNNSSNSGGEYCGILDTIGYG